MRREDARAIRKLDIRRLARIRILGYHKNTKGVCGISEDIMDYKNAGVDIEAGYKSVELMKKHIDRRP